MTTIPVVPAGLSHPGRRRLPLWRRLFLDPGAVLGILIVLAAVLPAILAPVLPLAPPDQIETSRRLTPPLSPGYPLGSDEVGRDLLSRLVWGARISLVAGIGATAVALGIGVALALLAATLGGPVDMLVMRCLDVIMAFPPLLLAIAIVAGLGASLTNAMLAVAIVGIPFYARLVRGEVLSLRELEYVQAARALGATELRIALMHLLPNLLSPLIVAASLDVGSKIIATASLSFLGLGSQPPTPDWGAMLADGRKYIATAPYLPTLPGLAVLLVVLAANLLGDAVRDGIDPRR